MNTRVIVIGGGPGGYVAAIRAAQLGASVTLVEKENLGGTCLNVGCIPTKVLLHSAELFNAIRHEGPGIGIMADNPRFDWSVIMKRKQAVVGRLVGGVDGLLRSNGVKLVKGQARLVSPGAVEAAGQRLEAEAVIVASGSVPAFPPVPGLDLPGVINSDGALSFAELPRTLAICGGGVIGVEFAQVFASFGVKVTVVEMLPRILPNVDAEVADVLRQALEKMGVVFHTAATLNRVDKIGQQLKLAVKGPKGEMELEVDKVLWPPAAAPTPSTWAWRPSGWPWTEPEF